MNWTNFSQFGLGFFSQVWRLFSVELPFLGLTAGQLLLGQLVVGMSIPLLKSMYSTFNHGVSYRSGHRRYQRKGGTNDKNTSD